MEQAYLKRILHYCPLTGVFTWLETRGLGGRGAVAGMVAGTSISTRYVSIRIDGTRYQAHRLAWLYATGAFPPGDIDHVNGVRNDNRLANLRAATRVQNSANRGVNRNNTTGVKGVTFRQRTRRYEVRLECAGRRRYVGGYPTLAAAKAAYWREANQKHGAFAHQGG